jgi:acyl dehydratase
MSTAPLLVVDKAADLAPHAGTLLGRSGWVTIDQPMIDAFANLTGDRHWIHVDTHRAREEMPGGSTIAHGLMVLSLIPNLQHDIYAVTRRGAGLNYGYDRVRFVSPVPVNSRVRLALVLTGVEPHAQGTRLLTEATIEIDGSDKPALVANNILLLKD